MSEPISLAGLDGDEMESLDKLLRSLGRFLLFLRSGPTSFDSSDSSDSMPLRSKYSSSVESSRTPTVGGFLLVGFFNFFDLIGALGRLEGFGIGAVVPLTGVLGPASSFPSASSSSSSVSTMTLPLYRR
jgi:hypothetical protein